VSRVYYSHLDGIRGLAALFVVLHHAFLLSAQRFPIRAQEGPAGLFSNWLLYGHLAVDVFIVLSGFCLALPVGRTGELRGGAKGFFLGRARRILPAYAAVTLASVAHLLFWQWRDTGSLAVDSRNLVAHLFLVQHLVPGSLLASNQPLWSVALEWQIYFLMPLLVLLLKRGTVSVLLVTALLGAGLTGLLVALGQPIPLQNHTCPWFVFLFGMGFCGGVVAERPSGLPQRRPFELLALVSGLVLAALLFVFQMDHSEYDLSRAFPAIDTAVGALTVALLVLAHPNRAAWLGARPLAALGTIGYSVYLIHFPVLEMLSKRVVKPLLPQASPEVQTLALVGLGLPFILGAAWVSWRLLERGHSSKGTSERS